MRTGDDALRKDVKLKFVIDRLARARARVHDTYEIGSKLQEKSFARSVQPSGPLFITRRVLNYAFIYNFLCIIAERNKINRSFVTAAAGAPRSLPDFGAGYKLFGNGYPLSRYSSINVDERR